MPGSGHCCRLQAEPFAVAQGIGARLARIAVGDHAEHTLPAAIRQSGGGNPEQETIMTGPFGATSTTDDVLDSVDLRGKRILVTGVSAGLGVETARALAAHGAQVVGAARDLDKAQLINRK
jgi:hypothetical protein